MTRAVRAGLWSTTGLLAIALLTVGVVHAAASQEEPDTAPVVTTPTATESANPFSAGGLQDPSAPADEVDLGVPETVRIPSLGVDSTLEDLAVDAAGELQAPVDYDTAGWYAEGVAPGSIGPAIIAGHIDSPTGPAVFQRLDELAPGDEIDVEMTGGRTLTFVVTGTIQSTKANFPTSDVYDNVPAPALRLITCAGDFDRTIGHYTDNLIVFASLAA